MRCPICNAENPAGSASCHQCGFVLSLEQTVWPDRVATPEEPVIDDLNLGESFPIGLDYPDLASPLPADEIEMAADTTSAVDSGEQLELPPEIDDASLDRLDESVEWPDAPEPPDVPNWMHDVDLEPAEVKTIDQISADRFRVQRSTGPSPARPAASVSVGPALLNQEIARVAVSMAILNAVLVGGMAVMCAGLVMAPLIGFLAGVRFRKEVLAGGVTPTFTLLLRPAAIVGGGAWLGELVGHLVWMSMIDTDISYTLMGLVFTACSLGLIFALLSVMATLFGGMVGASSRR